MLNTYNCIKYGHSLYDAFLWSSQCSRSLNLLGCKHLWDTSWKNICTHATHLSSTSNRGFWSISFFHQSVTHSLTQTVSEVHICCCLICIPGWWGNSSLGLPPTTDPSQTTGQLCASIIIITSVLDFKAPFNKISHFHEHATGIPKIPVPECASLFHMHEDRNQKLMENLYLVYIRLETISSFYQGVVSFLYGLRAHPYADGQFVVFTEERRRGRHEEGWKRAAYVSPQEPGGKACPTRATT